MKKILFMAIMAIFIFAACGAIVESTRSDPTKEPKPTKTSNPTEEPDKHFIVDDGEVIVFLPDSDMVYFNGQLAETNTDIYGSNPLFTADEMDYADWSLINNRDQMSKCDYVIDGNNVVYYKQEPLSEYEFSFDSEDNITREYEPGENPSQTDFTYDDDGALVKIEKMSTSYGDITTTTTVSYYAPHKPETIVQTSKGKHADDQATINIEYNKREMISYINNLDENDDVVYEYYFVYDEFDNLTGISIKDKDANEYEIEITYKAYRIPEEDFPFFYFGRMFSPIFKASLYTTKSDVEGYEGLGTAGWDLLLYQYINMGAFETTFCKCTKLFTLGETMYINGIVSNAMVFSGNGYKACSFNDLGITIDDIQDRYKKAPIDPSSVLAEADDAETVSDVSVVGERFWYYNPIFYNSALYEFEEDGTGTVYIFNYQSDDERVLSWENADETFDFTYKYDAVFTTLTLTENSVDTVYDYVPDMNGYMKKDEYVYPDGFEGYIYALLIPETNMKYPTQGELYEKYTSLVSIFNQR